MKTRKLFISIILMALLSFVLVFQAQTLWAQAPELGEAVSQAEELGEPEGEAGAEEHGLLDVAMRWINFAILFGGLGYLLRQPVAAFFEERRRDIASGLEKSQSAQESADALMADIVGRLSRLSNDIADIRSDAEETARKERERIVSDTKGEAVRVSEQSRAEVLRMARGMEQEVQADIVDRVVRGAEAALRSRLTSEDHGRLVRRAVNKF